MTLFHVDDTTPRKVAFGDDYGFVLAALPGLHPALILYGVRDERAADGATVERLLHHACQTGAPRNDLRAIYILHHPREGRNAPVTKVAATNISNIWTVHGFVHPPIAEEEWVCEQASLAGVP